MERVRGMIERHPLITAWIGLALAMVVVLLWASRDAGLLPTQLLALAVTTVLLAGACVWIISWE